MTIVSFIIGSATGMRISSLITGLSELLTTLVFIGGCPRSRTVTNASVEP